MISIKLLLIKGALPTYLYCYCFFFVFCKCLKSVLWFHPLFHYSICENQEVLFSVQMTVELHVLKDHCRNLGVNPSHDGLTMRLSFHVGHCWPALVHSPALHENITGISVTFMHFCLITKTIYNQPKVYIIKINQKTYHYQNINLSTEIHSLLWLTWIIDTAD